MKIFQAKLKVSRDQIDMFILCNHDKEQKVIGVNTAYLPGSSRTRSILAILAVAVKFAMFTTCYFTGHLVTNLTKMQILRQ